jgi:uncharacterized protein YoxC
MNVQKTLSIVVLAVVLFGSGFFTGLKYSSGTIEGLETDIVELTKRNKSLSTRINDLTAATRRDAEEGRVLAEGLGELSSSIATQVQRSRSIADRAQRINFLAGVLDKGITELIIKIEMVQERSLGPTGSSSD